MESSFGFDVNDYCNRHIILHQAAKFRLNPTALQLCSYDVMTLYRFSRWRPVGRNFTSGFGLNNVSFFTTSIFITIPNIVVITQSTAEI